MNRTLHRKVLGVLAIGCALSTTARSVAQDVAAKPPSPAAADRSSGNPHSRAASARAAVISARRSFLRAAAAHDPLERERRYQAARTAVSRQLSLFRGKPKATLDLLATQETFEIRMRKRDAAELTARHIRKVSLEAFGPVKARRWLNDYANRVRRRGDLDLAIFHLEEAIRSEPGTPLAARQGLTIGDILAQQAYPDGPYISAITEYSRVARKYGAIHPEIADDANIRRAKYLVRDGHIDEARSLFKKLLNRPNIAVAETAEHYVRMLYQKMNEQPSEEAATPNVPVQSSEPKGNPNDPG